ncbi:alpha-1,6-mannosyl-glycoprotein 4-beta-N-acetylglucosaminyltransferase-like isoform X2 [Mytilus edulis]|uniref:alpha-1,6-mannosyl-glycoprotein 4-beta-N-acetylglucosaminyltransferase-like isoform X2 n=1 Tax=Mytilus edulis TaxID=6550 RepID=UPI0039EF340D
MKKKNNILQTILGLVTIMVIIAVMQLILFFVQIQKSVWFYQNNNDKEPVFRYLSDTRNKLPSTPSRSLFPRFNLDALYPNWTENATLWKLQGHTNKRYLTIGMVTAKRRNNTVYLFETLNSLITNANGEELLDIYIVILLSDIDEEWRKNISSTIQMKYPDEVKNGTIQIITSFHWMYPRLQNLTHHYVGHSENKVKWKSKQNIDFVLLWLYVFKSRLSEYYLHLEDDVITVPGYIKMIKDFVNEQKKRWTCLEFSILGMIAKLYRTQDLEALAKMVALFYEEQPADVTFLYFNPQMLQFKRIVRKPTLFQHIGKTSSLKGKTMLVQDWFFIANFRKTLKGDNPQATLLTNLKFSSVYSPENAYNKDFGYFSSEVGPKKNDYFKVVFKTPQIIQRIVVKSGLERFPKDKFYNAVLEVSSRTDKTNNCTDYHVIGKFVNGTIDVQNFTTVTNTNTTMCIQIRVLRSQKFWVKIPEISVFLTRSNNK